MIPPIENEQVYMIFKNPSLTDKPIITDEETAANPIVTNVAKINEPKPIIREDVPLNTSLNIEDIVQFRHEFIKEVPCICGDLKYISEFQIPGLGEFRCGYKAYVRCPFMPSICRPSGPSCLTKLIEFCSCDEHSYPQPDYCIENQVIRMEFWQEGTGKIKINGRTVIEFIQTFPNHCDAAFAHCKSSFPKLRIHFMDHPGRVMILKPDVSDCPESILGVLLCCAICGITQQSRKFDVALGTGSCQITNTRTLGEAFAKVCLLQGCCFLPDVDYPQFQVNFKGEDQIEKLAILMGLMHYSIFKKWYLIARITYNITGIA